MHKVFLPYSANDFVERQIMLGLIVSSSEQAKRGPFEWLSWYNSEGNFKGDFEFEVASGGANLIFTEEEDMQLFILRWM